MKEILAHRASRAQQRLWFVEQLVPGEPVHNISFQARYPGLVEPAPLRAAVADLVARHEPLRTRFEVRGGVLWQVVLTPPDQPPVEFVDLTGQPGGAYRELCERAGRAAFDLAVAPLLRLLHVRRDEGDALVSVLHHAVADAASVSILLRELAQAYEARVAGRAPGWAEPELQYADFTAWQEEQLGRPEARRDLDYWRAQLADLSTLDLTHGRPRPAAVSHRGARIDVAVDAGTGAQLAAFGRAGHATPFMGLLAAYAAALGRVFGTEDVAVTSSVAGRPLPQVQQMVGMFVDRVVLRLDLSGGPTFRELVAAARQVVADAHNHSAVTFDQIVDALAPDRELGVTPLAQAAINLQPPSRGPGSALLRPVGGSLIDTGTVAHDLALDLVEEGTRYAGTVRYRSGVVSPDAAARVAALFGRILRAGLADPDRPLWTVPAVEPAELARLHATGSARGTDRPAHEPVTGWARRSPHAPAVRGPAIQGPAGAPNRAEPDRAEPDRAEPDHAGLDHTEPAHLEPQYVELDYAELEARANALARTLREYGVGAEMPVLVAIPRSVEFVVGMLAVLKAGGAFVPVDPAAPAAHLAAVSGQVGARLALTLPGTSAALPDGVAVLPVELAGPAPADPGPPEPVAGPGNAAYVLFTSGSTGVPKGVVVEHRNLAAYTGALLDRLDPPGGSSFLLLQPVTFDSCLTTVFGALASGGVLDIIDEQTAADPDTLAAHLAGQPADHVKTTPTHLAALLATGDPAAPALRPRRALILGCEASSREFTGRLLAAGWRIFAHYGPTETTVGVGADWLTPASGAGAPTTPLGRPLAGVGAYVLDGRLQPVPPGCLGELYVGGPQVSRGYAGALAATAARYLPDPFAGQPGARMYATGDLVRRLPDGMFEYCGRTDRQLKIRGYRVEPGAVEAALEAHPDVLRAAVVARGPLDRRQLVGYVVGAGRRPDPERLREFAGRTLPGYAVPGTVVVLDELPATAHGKLDLAALPDPAFPAQPALPTQPGQPGQPAQPGQPEPSRVAAHGRVEEALLDSWRAALPDREFGVTDGFFAVGGDSILAIHVVADARRRGLPLTVRHLFEQQTIRAIAALLGELEPEPEPALPAAVPSGGALPAAVSPEGTPSEAVLPEEAVAALRGPAHEAYGTTAADLVAAATLTALGGPPAALLVAAGGGPEISGPAAPVLVRFERLPDELVELVPAVKAAIRAASGDRPAEPAAGPAGSPADEPAGDGEVRLWVIELPAGASVTDLDTGTARFAMALAGDRVLVTGPAAGELAVRVRDRLVELVTHCTGTEPVYSGLDFPDAGLDDAGVAALLAGMGLGPGEEPGGRP